MQRPDATRLRPLLALSLLGMLAGLCASPSAGAAGCHAGDRPTFGLDDPWGATAAVVEVADGKIRTPPVIDRLPCSNGQPIQVGVTAPLDPPAQTATVDLSESGRPSWRRPRRSVCQPPLGFPAELDRPPRTSAG